MDDVSSMFHDAAESVPIPPSDLGAVVRRGRSRRRRRLAVNLVSAAFVVLATWGVATIFAGQDMRPVPATPDEARGLGGRLVPVVMEGPPPFPELSSEEDRATARAVAVAFHALLSALPDYDLDYEDVVRTGQGWSVRFLIAPAMEPVESSFGGEPGEVLRQIEEALHARRAVVASLKADVERVREHGRGRRLRTLQENLKAAKVAARELEREARALRGRVEGLGTHELVLMIEERDGMVLVDGVLAGSAGGSRYKGAAGYAEPKDDVDAWGADYYDAFFRRKDASTVDVFVRPFWTGPLYAPYEERCRAQVVERGGAVVWTQPEQPRVPGAPQHFDTAPSTEDARDGGQISFGVDYEGDLEDLSLRMLCEWRPRQ